MDIFIPESDCGIRVGNEKRKWKAGRSSFFNDNHEHEAWNKTQNTRVVLFIDFMRSLSQPIRLINNIVYKNITNNKFTKQFVNNAKYVTINY
jgi:beta-hydroxylase